LKGVNYREPHGMPYVRREYISGKPQLKIAKFSSGQPKSDYDYKVELLVTEKLQIRHNALEAARLAANKTMATAGADRLQEGMRRAFGKAMGLAARVHPQQSIYEAYVMKENLDLAKRGLKVAASKLGCPTEVRVVPLREIKSDEDEG
jgi:large subunit ribosomal protein L10e